MKKILLSLIVIVTIGFVNAQTFNMQNDSVGINCTTGGTLYDSGGNGSNYGANENFIFTVCPGSSGFGIHATLDVLDISFGDTLNIYNGNSTSSTIMTGMPIVNGTLFSAGAIFQSSDTSGCMTIEFISDGANFGNFEFNFACGVICQPFYSGFSTFLPDTTMTPTDLYLDACFGDTVYTTALNDYFNNNLGYAQSDATSSFAWYYEDTTTVPAMGVSQSHYYAEPGGYRARMVSYDINGCRNYQDQVFKVRIAPEPALLNLSDTIICLGDQDTLSALPEGNLIGGVIVVGETVYFTNPPLNSNQFNLPDGSGVNYLDTVFSSGYGATDIVQNCGAGIKLHTNLEHSYLGDLEMILRCPNGTEVSIINSYGSGPGTLTPGGFGGGGTHLGEPIDGGGTNGIPGYGWDYDFYDAAPNPEWTNATPTTPTTAILAPNGITMTTAGNSISAGDYQPDEALTGLIGCPLNGAWLLEIRDNLASDDGFIFEWSLEFDPCMNPDVDSFELRYDLGYWDPAPTIVDTIGSAHRILIQPDSAGMFQYTYHTENQFGCQYERTYEIFSDGVEVDVTPSDTLVCAFEPVQLEANLVDPQTGITYTYNWAPSTDLNNSTISNPVSTLSTGGHQYIAEVTSSNNCSFYDTSNVNIDASFQFGIMADTTICVGQSVNLTTSGGATDYAWTTTSGPSGSLSDTTLANPLATPTSTTSYNVVADSLTIGCPQYANVTVSVSNIVYNPFLVNAATPGNSDGSIFSSGSGNVGPLSFTIDGGVPQANGFFFGLAPGDHIVVVSDGSGCDVIDTVTVPGCLSPLVVDSVHTVDPSCGGYTDGLIELFLTDTLAATYTIDIGSVSQDSSKFLGLTDTTYIISIDDLNGSCPIIFDTVTLVAPTTLNLVINDSTDLTCYNNSTGLINISANGGTPSYDFSFNGSAFGATTSFPNLSAGAYNTKVKDSNGCLDSILVNISQPDSLTLININVGSVLCFGDSATISFDGQGGTSPYEYSIVNPASFGASNSFLMPSGNYSLSIKDDENCLSEFYLDTVFAPTSPVIVTLDSVTNADCNISNGIIYTTGSGGQGPYTYSIDNGTTNQNPSTFNGQPAGMYTVLITDDNGCTNTVNAQILNNSPISISLISVDSVSCFGLSDATVVLSSSLGVDPITFQIDALPVQNDSIFTNISGGVHTFTVEDLNGCDASINVTIFEPSQLVLSTTSTVDLTCDESADGEIHVTAVGGILPYTYALDNISTIQANGDFLTLDAGNHIAYVSDATGCIDSLTAINLTQPDTLVITNVAVQDIDCNGSFGSFTVTATGGSIPYSYDAGGASQASNVLGNLSGGVYTITVSDANAICPSAVIVDSIFEPTILALAFDSIKNINCFGGNDGYISCLASGGVGPYTYSIDNIVFQTLNEFNSLTAGAYTIYVKDDNNCPISLALNLTQGSAINVSTAVNSVSCFGSSDGIITLSAISGGVGTYTISLDGLASVNVIGNSHIFQNLPAGNHTIEVFDNNSCSSGIYNVTIIEPGKILLKNMLATDVSCFGDGNGLISLAVEQGTPSFTFNIENNGLNIGSVSGNTANFPSLNGGVYLTYVIDAGLCSDSLVITINEPSELLIDSLNIIDQVSCFGSDDATLIVFPSGGNPFGTNFKPYNYLWSPSGGTSERESGLTSGVHSVTVTDSEGCSVTATKALTPVEPLIANILPDSAFITMGQTLQLSVNIQNTLSNNLQYDWSPSNGLSCTDCANPLVTIYNDIEYTLVVTDENGCTNYNTSQMFIGVSQALFYFVPNGFTPNGDGINDYFEVLGEDIKSVNMKVYNRWGEKIFEGANQFQLWDGTFNGVPVETGAYSYNIDLEFLNDSKVNKKGSLSLIR